MGTVFNAQLNQGLEWNSARETAVEEALKMKASYDDYFCIDDQDPVKSEAIWTKNMNYFDVLIQTIQAIK
jgi:hypothetical protein